MKAKSALLAFAMMFSVFAQAATKTVKCELYDARGPFVSTTIPGLPRGQLNEFSVDFDAANGGRKVLVDGIAINYFPKAVIEGPGDKWATGTLQADIYVKKDGFWHGPMMITGIGDILQVNFLTSPLDEMRFSISCAVQ